MNNIGVLGKDCCGCTACEQICPKKCIIFKETNEGFMYPSVDEKVCINCGVCVKHCPIMTTPHSDGVKNVYAAKYNDRQTTIKSTSGGIFLAIAEKILNEGGIVFGCAYDENLVAKHISVESISELYKLQGSKYVQSDISGIYSKVKNELNSGRQVLFSGTGCQAAGLRSFLGKDYDNLLITDIVCHGVPSPKLFAGYIDYLGKKTRETITEFNLRSKTQHGWGCYYEYKGKTKSHYGNSDDDLYYNAFIKSKIMRESCYGCNFANCDRQGDITLADFWGIECINPKFYSKDGVSLVLVNTEKGQKLWKTLKNEIESIDSTIELAVKMNKNLAAPSSRPECRDTIYEGIDGDFDSYVAQKLYVKPSLKRKIKALVPVSLKGRIKYMLKKF